MALDTRCGGRGAWLAESPGGLIYTSRCWARAGCKQISQDRCGNHLVPDKPSRVATTRDTPPRNVFFRVVTDVYPPVCNDVAWTMPPVNRREQCPWHTRRRSGYVLTATLIASLRLTTPAPLVLITIIITLALRTGFLPAPSHSTRMCFVLLTQMLGAGTPAHDFVTPLTFSHSGCHTTRSSFAFLSFLSFLLFQLVTRCSKSETQTTQQLCWLPSRGGDDTKKPVLAPVQTEDGPTSSSEQQLGSLIESYSFASLRYAAAGGMRSFRQPPLSLSLPLPLFSALESREKA